MKPYPHPDDASYRCAVFAELSDYPKTITAKPTVGKAIQITGVSQVDAVISALRGQRESPYTITVTGDPSRFTVAVDSVYGDHASLFGFAQGDWLVQLPDELPKLIGAKEFTTYWEVKK